MNVVIVESAAKAKAINKYLGSGYRVIASYGHVRDLPSKDGSVEPDNDFAMHWAADDDRGRKVMREIAEAVKKADKLILATDPDREGEAISWHILELLNQKKALRKGTPVERVTFNAVTKQSVLDAMKAPRDIDAPLVEAYLARRALDYLVGFNLSPVLWRKLPGARSAGRVQSVALRLVCDRELEIERFRTEEYWTIVARLATAKAEDIEARLHAIDGARLDRLAIKTEASAAAIKAAVDGRDFTVRSVDKQARKRNPYAPFSTSTLQMDASRKLGYSAKQTMNIAQRLYEGVDLDGETVGLITYMRTDGVTIIPEAVAQIRRQIEADFGKRYVAPFIREYKAKAKNAQEAHEAIRPTDVRRRPQDVARFLDKDQARLYELIWKRAVASQMASADVEQTTADIDVKGRDGKAYGFRATGSVIQFDGFLRLYEEGRDDRQLTIDRGKDDRQGDEDDATRLPPLAAGDRLRNKGIDTNQHFTQPPPRYTEATLVKRMEELGIGRPSTYASTLAVLQERAYVRIDKKRLVPEDKGRLVTAFLESFFLRYVEYDYTASLEEKLDLISDHKLAWKEVLRDFWREFISQVAETKELDFAQVREALTELLAPHIFPDRGDGSNPRTCPRCGLGTLSLVLSRDSGAFIGCSNYKGDNGTAPCTYRRSLSPPADGEEQAGQDRSLGVDPDTGLEVHLKNGRFGWYVQLGDAAAKGEKPKRASLPKGWEPETLDLERALRLLSLPRLVGKHPETQAPILAGIGRFGPFVVQEAAAGEDEKKRVYANLESVDEVFEIGLNRAVTVLAEKAAGKVGRFGRGQAQRKVLKELGEHPEGGRMEVLDGRYGPYVAWNGVNATIPRGKEPGDVTVEEAVALLAERAAKGGGKKGGFKAKTKGAKSAASSAANDDGVPARKAAPRKKTPAKSPRKDAAE
ncbi:MAG: type I DNA topoisomerase [Hyphomicrobiaceae bacterium]|nr:type I DNA topoisomerase [Hyphomicrobiaceae bacterium]